MIRWKQIAIGCAAALWLVVGCSSGGGSKGGAACADGGLLGCPSGSSGSAAAGAGGQCTPQANDTACDGPLKANCCDQIVACNADPVCVDCIKNGCASPDTVTQNFVTCFCAQSVCKQAAAGTCP